MSVNADKGREFGVALLGAGTVGGGVHDLIAENSSLVASRSGIRLKVVSVAARNAERARTRTGGGIPVFDNWRGAVAVDGVDVVVELMGGTDDARDCALACAEAKQPFVTANKALLATHGAEIFARAREAGTGVYFEAAVAGCVPAIRTLRESLSGDRVRSVLGIVNGTCNYILSRMESDGIGFDEALAAASELGYAEADPSLDIDGFDAAHKAVLMSWLSFGTPLGMDRIDVAGIRSSDPVDDSFASEFGYVIRLVAMAIGGGDGVALRVSPALVAKDHSMAKVTGTLNAVLIDSDAAGEIMLVGAGAGAKPTASAVASDIIQAAVERGNGWSSQQPLLEDTNVLPLAKTSCQAYIRLRVVDTKGVIARVSKEMSEVGVSIEAIHQNESVENDPTDISMLLHENAWGVFAGLAAEFKEQGFLLAEPVLLPVAVPHNR